MMLCMQVTCSEIITFDHISTTNELGRCFSLCIFVLVVMKMDATAFMEAS